MTAAADPLEDLRDILAALGRAWARSKHHLHPEPAVLAQWDDMLDRWVGSDVPLLLRNTRLRGTYAEAVNRRSIRFADNFPANWAFGMALARKVPDVPSWSREELEARIPVSFLHKWPAAGPTNLNLSGWKICHVEAVAGRPRLNLARASLAEIEAQFRRFISPRNMFLIPKAISGAGELEEVIRAVVEHRVAAAGRSQ